MLSKGRLIPLVLLGVPVLGASSAHAHHDERANCRYGQKVVPGFVQIESYRMFERCEGPTVTVLLPGGQSASVAYRTEQKYGRQKQSRPKRCKKRKRCNGGE